MMLAVLAACGRGTPSAAADTTAAAAPAAPVTHPASGKLASSGTFTSLLGDFEFAVPDSWAQRYTATERAKPPEYPGTQTVTEFLFLPMSGGTPPALLTILQYSEKDWKAIGAGPSKPSGTVVAEGGGRVFVAVLLASIPFPAGSEDAVAIAPMIMTPEQVSEAMRIR
jgi:hypothetical protein